jgi:hypothetical protein
MTAHIYSLQAQVDALHASVSAWWNTSSSNSTFDNGSHIPRLSPPARTISETPGSQSQYESNQQYERPRSQEPTSNVYRTGNTQSAHQVGIVAPEDPVDNTEGTLQPVQVEEQSAFHRDKDPLWRIGRVEALRLLSVYENDIGTMEPLIDTRKLTEQAMTLYAFMEAAIKTQLFRGDLLGSDTLEGDYVHALKMVLAIALVVENGGESELAQDLFESVRPAVEKKMWSTDVDFPSVTLIALVVSVPQACYFFP